MEKSRTTEKVGVSSREISRSKIRVVREGSLREFSLDFPFPEFPEIQGKCLDFQKSRRKAEAYFVPYIHNIVTYSSKYKACMALASAKPCLLVQTTKKQGSISRISRFPKRAFPYNFPISRTLQCSGNLRALGPGAICKP